MLLLRVNKNAIGPPVAISHDWGRDFFEHTTRFRTKVPNLTVKCRRKYVGVPPLL